MRTQSILSIGLLLIFILTVLAPVIAYAAIPETLSYKGALTDSSNNTVSGTHNFTIRIYDASSSGTLLYAETHTGITVTRGSFDLSIGGGVNSGGTVTNIRDLAWDQQYFISLEVTSLSTGEMSPRTPINSAAYSFITKAVIAQTSAPLNPKTGALYFNTDNNSVYSYTGTEWVALALASSTIADLSGTTTTAIAEGTNLYWTNTRFDNRLSATTSLPSITTLSGLSLPASQLTDFGKPFYQFFSATTTSALTEGINLYFTNARADARINATSSIGTLTTASNLTTVGALSSGSIASGFGAILTSNTITGTTLSGTTGINTGAGAGIQRIDSSGNLVNIGTASTTLLSALNTIYIGSTATTTIVGNNATSTFSGQARADLIHSNTQLVLGSLLNCDTLDTDANGVVKCGSDATGGASTNDLQDAYDNAAADAQIFTADAKDIIFHLIDSATDPNFLVAASPDAQGQFRIGTADGSATTTTGVWETYGRLGIATSSPGTGLAVQATTTLLGLDTYIYGQLTLPNIKATSTINNSFAGALDVTEAATSTFAGGITVATGGLEVTAGGLRVDVGDAIFDQIIKVLGTATSTITTLTATDINTGSLTLTGTLELETSGTSTIPAVSSTNISVTGLQVNGDINLPVDSIQDTEVVDALTISGGTINNSTIGLTTPLAGTFTNLIANLLLRIAGNIETAGDVSVSGGDLNLGNGTATSTLTVSGANLLGLGSTTPWGIYSIEQIASGDELLPALVIGDQGTKTPAFIVMNGTQRVGIATSTPESNLSVAGDGYLSGGLAIGTDATSTPGHLKAGLLHSDTQLVLGGLIGCDTLDTDANGVVKCGSDATSAGASKWTDATTYITPDATLTANDEFFRIWDDGTVSIGTTTDDAPALTVRGDAIIGGGSLSVEGLIKTQNFIATSTGIFSGIGTTSPGELFSVGGRALFAATTTVGDLYATSSIRLGSLANCGAGNAVQTDAQGHLKCGAISVDGFTFKSKSADQAVNNSTTLTDETALQVTLGANEEWNIQWYLMVTNGSSAGPDWKSAVKGAVGTTCTVMLSGTESGGSVFPQATATDCDDIPAAMANGTIASDGGVPFEVLMTANVTAPAGGATMIAQWAQNSATAVDLTIKAGSFVVAYKVTGADLAETYFTRDSDIRSGDVVSIDGAMPMGVKKTEKAYDPGALGVVSTKPGLVLGASADNLEGGVMPVLVALTGRVPVKVTAENGAIQPGDLLTSSSIPGVAMKATQPGPIIGQALSSFNGQNNSDVGTIMMFIKNSYYQFSEESISLNSQNGQFIDGLTFIGTVQTETPIDAIAAITDRLTAGIKTFTDFISARITAIRGYFDELFSKKIHTEQICLKKSDGGEVCVTGDQLQNIVNGNGIVPTVVSANESVNDSNVVNEPNPTISEPVSADTSSIGTDITEVASGSTDDSASVNTSVDVADASVVTDTTEMTPSTTDDNSVADIPTP